MKKVVPSERLRRELDDVLGGIGEEQHALAVALVGLYAILRRALDLARRRHHAADPRGVQRLRMRP
jgi:hypothetical protein